MTEEKPKTPPSRLERRTFLSRVWIFFGFVVLIEFFAGAFSFFISGRKKKDDSLQHQLIDAGSLADFIPGTVTLVHPANCFVSRLKDGGMLAISRKCTHLGCAVPWIAERNQFECPCHASIFDITGNVLQSPASRALDLYPLSLVRGRLLIDIGTPRKRSSFAAEQLFYPGEKG